MEQTSRATLPDYVASFSCVLVLFAGYFKANPALAWIPVDLTALACGFVVIGLLLHFMHVGLDLRISPWALLFFAAFVPAWFHGEDNAYTMPKLVGMIVVVISMLGSFYLVNNRHRLQIWLGLLVVVGAFTVILGAGGSQTDQIGRLALEGSNTIAAGRATGVALTVVVALALLMKGKARFPLLLIGLVFGATAVSTGSRGPLLAAAIAICAVVVLANIGGRFGRIVIFGLVAASGWWYITEAQAVGAGRIAAVLTGEQTGTESRRLIWGAALRSLFDFPQNVAGAGWSNFKNELGNGESLSSGDVQYAHNVILEAFVEGGWIAGIATVLFIGLSLRRLVKSSSTPLIATLLAVAVFFTVNAMVSGDIGDNRTMWAALALAWVNAAQPPAKDASTESASNPGHLRVSAPLPGMSRRSPRPT